MQCLSLRCISPPRPSNIANVGYHIYCPEQQILPSLLLHELVHVSQFVNSAGRSVSKFGRIYLQQYCDAGYYEGIPWEREAFEREKVLYPAPGDSIGVQFLRHNIISTKGSGALLCVEG
jgi:hypothetical protein